ncbi:MAG: TIGR04282 family arsenosugar biosynthesis glycosyltransferase [Pseudomonadota bacterium]
MKNTLILFTKEPIAGSVKTRLIPALGEHGAYLFYCQLIKLMLKRFAKSHSTDFVIYTNQKDSSKNINLPNPDSYFKQYPQVKTQYGKDLGEKMYNALARELHLKEKIRAKKLPSSKKTGQYKVLLFGADCPFLTKKIIQYALNSLDTKDMVFVPVIDGGYVLIGAKRICPEIFQNISWSTSKVMLQTLQNLEKLGYSYQLLETLNDIDEPKDLEILKNNYLAKLLLAK